MKTIDENSNKNGMTNAAHILRAVPMTNHAMMYTTGSRNLRIGVSSAKNAKNNAAPYPMSADKPNQKNTRMPVIICSV